MNKDQFGNEKVNLVYQSALARLKKEILTTQEAMGYLSVSRKTLDRLREENEIKCIKVRGCNRFNLIDLVEYSLSINNTNARKEFA